MNISKTTFNMALKRGIELEVYDAGDKLLLLFWRLPCDSEWLFSYQIGDVLTFNGNLSLAVEAKEELPATIFNEVQLRNVIKWVAQELDK